MLLIVWFTNFLVGQRIVIVRCEQVNISGSFYRNKCKLIAVLKTWGNDFYRNTEGVVFFFVFFPTKKAKNRKTDFLLFKSIYCMGSTGKFVKKKLQESFLLSRNFSTVICGTKIFMSSLLWANSLKTFAVIFVYCCSIQYQSLRICLQFMWNCKSKSC